MTNHDLEKLVETSNEWIIERTGIRERRRAAPDVAASDLAATAALEVLRKTGISADQIDLIIFATTTPDFLMPNTACILQKKIGATKAAGFDLLAACSGWLYGLSVAHQYINTGKAKYVLVVGAEVLSRIVNWQDRTTCILFGDGAAVSLVGVQRPGSRGELIDEFIQSDGRYADLLDLPMGGSALPIDAAGLLEGKNKIHMKGREIFKTAVKAMIDCCDKVLERNNVSLDEIKWIIPHQANSRIIDAVGERLKGHSHKLLCNVESYGNTSSATVPSVLDQASSDGRIKSGDLVLATVFGGGLTSGAALFRWGN